MNIGEASKHTGLPVKTIRYYEEIGLVRADRQANGYRDYAQNHLQKLLFLKRSRQFNFSLGECRQLLGLYGDEKRESAEVKALAVRHLEELKLKAVELENLAATLEQLIQRCAGDGQPNCPIIEGLSGGDSVTTLDPTEHHSAEEHVISGKQKV